MASQPSTPSKEYHVASPDSEEGAPILRKPSFVDIIQRAFGLLFRTCTIFIPKHLLKGRMGFLYDLPTKKMTLWSILLCIVSVFYTVATFIGDTSPQLVPYSEQVEHLQSKTVTTALSEEGSNQLYFNLQRTESKPGDTADPQVSDTQNGKEAIASMPLAHAVIIDMNNSERIGEPKRNSANLPSVSMQSITSQKNNVSSKWAYRTLKVEKDEAFLLQLMRDAGAGLKLDHGSPIEQIVKWLKHRSAPGKLSFLNFSEHLLQH